MSTKLKVHPLADLFPLMEGEDFAKLVESIKTDGQKNKIVLLDNKILDGRNRHNACLEAKVEPQTVNFHGKDPAAFVWAMNGVRRHLTVGQLAAIGAKIAELAREEAEKSGTPVEGETTAAAAEKVGVSQRSVERALAVKKRAPKKFEKVAKGDISLNEAEASGKAAAEKRKAAQEDKDYDVALKRIGHNCGMTFRTAVTNGTILNTKAEAIRYANLETDEMERIKLLVQQGWTVGKALKYKSTALTRAHRIKDLLDRAAGAGGKFELLIEGWVVNVRKQ
jgi:hypothetical protein